MKKCILSYSMTGNNGAFAKRLSKNINAEHIIVAEKERNIAKILLDIIFNRIPKVQPNAYVLNDYDELIIIGPIWMEKVASPLRPYLLHIKDQNLPYKFVTISGGALNRNPKLKKDLIKYGGKKLLLPKELYISDLFSKDDASTKNTSEYKVTENDLDVLEKTIAQTL